MIPAVSTGIIDLMAMTLRLNDEQHARLREVAEREGISMHEAVVRAVDDYTTRRARRRDELIARMIEEDAGVLERLANA